MVYDVENFLPDHPGGRALLESMTGRDVTFAFTGGVHKHRDAAYYILPKLRVARMEVVENLSRD